MNPRARHTRVAIVGAGPHALTVVAHLVHLDPSLRGEIVVIDPSGSWLERWNRTFARFGIEALRSPAVHHPHPDPYALLTFAHDHARQDEFCGTYRSPGTGLFADFCASVVERYGLEDLVTAGSVVSLDDGGALEYRAHARAGSDDAADTVRVAADHVVVAHGASTPVVPDWAAPHLGPTPGPVRHATTVDVRDACAGDHVVVIGGGSTAGHLAIGAAERGARVTLVHRRAVAEREFDTDPGWLGPKELVSFAALPDDRSRAAAASAARGGGSMPRRILERLAALEVDGRLRRCLGHVHHVSTDLAEAIVAIGTPERVTVRADHVWCATGWRPDPRADPVLGPFVRRNGLRPIDGFLPLAADLTMVATEPSSTRIHVLGRAATLRLGPTAGNLSGGRAAADILVTSVLGLDALHALETSRGTLPV